MKPQTFQSKAMESATIKCVEQIYKMPLKGDKYDLSSPGCLGLNYKVSAHNWLIVSIAAVRLISN